MSDPLHTYRCVLEGDIIVDSTTPTNTSGAFCDLFTATHPTLGKLALKRPRGDHYDENVIARMEIEAGVWALLNHPRILQFLGIRRIDEDLYLVSPFAENGSLIGFLKRRPDVDRRRLVIEIAEGLAYLHQCGIIHGDLKGNNILISGSEHAMLCDFGLAKHVTSRTSTSLRGTGSIPWQSPELLQDACRRTFQSDVYAFGITVYEVLSGMEPYTHHTGIVSIITGVVFNGERPPREPMTALDGTSYLQFWDEASRCWAENSAARPRIIDVLSRLDRQRAEALVTSRQLMLEDSLVLPVEGLAISQSYSGLGSSLPDVSATEIRDTLDWAYSIRSRTAVLVNSRQRISRAPPGIIAMIIMAEAAKSSHGQGRVKFTREWQPNFTSLNELYIARIARFAELRTVCKAWRDAIDGTPEFTQCILVEGGRNNIEYVLRHNHDSPLELLLDSSTTTELQSVLEPLACRLLSAYLTHMIAPAPFPILQAIRISGTRVPDTFVADLSEMLRVCPNVEELILDSLTNESLSNEDSPRERPDQSGLQRVRITRLPLSLQLGVLQSLRLQSHATLIVDQMHPDYLCSPDSVVGNIIRSLGPMESSSIHNGILQVERDMPHRNPFDFQNDRGNLIAFTWSASGCNLPDERSGKGAGASWTSFRLESRRLTNDEAVEMISMLEHSGVVIKTAELFTSHNYPYILFIDFAVHEKKGRDHLLPLLPRVEKLTMGAAALSVFWDDLTSPISVGVDRDDMFLLPYLTQLELLSSISSDDILERIRELIMKRQKGRPKTRNPAKLERVGLQYLYNLDRFSDPAFDGIEFYLVD